MKLRTMRAVDYWVGIPLCFLFTSLQRLLGSISPSSAVSPPPKKILFIELSEMGSTVIANPALRKAKEELGAEVYFLIFERNVESLKLLDTVPPENVFTISECGMKDLVLGTFSFLRWARRTKIDTVIDMEMFSRYSALLTGLSGATRRVGFHRFHGEGLYRGEMLTHRVSYNGHIHMAKNFVSMVNALLAPQPQVPYSKAYVSDDEVRVPILPVSQAEEHAIHTLIAQVYDGYDPNFHRVVLLNPNSSEMLPQRRWPEDNFSALGELIVSEWEDVIVLITGSASEREEALRMQEQVNHPRFRSFAGMHKLRSLIPLYNVASVLVTNDSGPAHFSAITPIRSIVLFGPETPKLYSSLGNTESITAELSCSPCVTAANQKNSACNDAVCMRMITPPRVLQSIRLVLDGEDVVRDRLVQLVPVSAMREL